MEDKNISQIVLDQIKGDSKKPRPRSFYIFKKVLFWGLVSVAIIVGSISFSVILLLVINNDWVLFNKLGFNLIVKTFPYLWVIFLLIFAFLGEFYYRKTPLGYRRNILIVVGLYGIITITFGSVIYSLGIGEVIEESLSNNVPIYRNMMFNKDDLWKMDEEGLISGVITNINDEFLQLKDRDGNIWNINIKDADIGGRVNMVSCAKIKIIGDKINEKSFNAEIIRPWMKRGGQMVEENCLMVR